MLACYRSIMQKMGLSPDHPSMASYNLILTPQYMMGVPRTQEQVGPVSLNSMGYAGTMLIRSTAEQDFIREQGPISILAAAGQPWAAIA